MATALPIFVSHSHEDGAFCQALVTALRGAGADVWYDEQNMGSGLLMSVIQSELGVSDGRVRPDAHDSARHGGVHRP